MRSLLLTLVLTMRSMFEPSYFVGQRSDGLSRARHQTRPVARFSTSVSPR